MTYINVFFWLKFPVHAIAWYIMRQVSPNAAIKYYCGNIS